MSETKPDYEVIAKREGITVELAHAASDLAQQFADATLNAPQTNESVVISSLVVETACEYTQAVAEAINATAGAEVFEINGYKVVVLIEAPTVDASADIANSFIGITGVLGINLVYCNFEDDPTLYPES